MTGGATAAHVAGSRFDELPLAYQQIIFDAGEAMFHGQLASTMDSSLQSVKDVEAADGTFSTIAPEVQETMEGTQEELVDGLIEDGRIDEGIREQLTRSAEKWTGIVEDLGYEDGGELEDLDEWYEAGSLDFRPLGERVFEEAGLAHRPE